MRKNKKDQLNLVKMRYITNKKELIMDLCDINNVDDCIEIIWDFDLAKEELDKILK